jgi:acyl-CoA reductase-like NAD-dependent aldehyde dehydrogenase
MVNRLQFYIDGSWVDPVVKKTTPVVNPATEEAMYACGSALKDHRNLQGPHEGDRNLGL